MHQILVWPLSDTAKLQFVCDSAGLGSITCCDTLTIQLISGLEAFNLLQNVSGCQVLKFEKILQDLISKKVKDVTFEQVLQLSAVDQNQMRLRLNHDAQVIFDQPVSLDMVFGWARQLDLLKALMEENENEQKSRGKGCC
jgi:hypothetical protein